MQPACAARPCAGRHRAQRGGRGGRGRRPGRSDGNERLAVVHRRAAAAGFDGRQGAAGHLYLTYHFTNVGGTCHTRGWVGALLFGTDGRPLPTHLSRVGGAATLTLAHNATASWAFGYVNPAILGCRPPASSALIITPPDSATPVLQTRSFSPCNGQFTATGLQAGG